MLTSQSLALLAAIAYSGVWAAPLPQSPSSECLTACSDISSVVAACPTTSIEALQNCACVAPNFVSNVASCLECARSSLSASQISALEGFAQSCSSVTPGSSSSAGSSAVSSSGSAVSSGAVASATGPVTLTFWQPEDLALTKSYEVLRTGGPNTTLVAINPAYYTDSASQTLSTGTITEIVVVQPSEALYVDRYDGNIDYYDCEQTANNGTGSCVVGYGSSVSDGVTFTFTRTITGLPGASTTYTAEPYTPSSLRSSAAGSSASAPLVTSTGFGGGIGGGVSGGGAVPTSAPATFGAAPSGSSPNTVADALPSL